MTSTHGATWNNVTPPLLLYDQNVLFPDIWLTPPPPSTGQDWNPVPQPSAEMFIFVISKWNIPSGKHISILVSLFSLPWPPRNTKVGCSSPYSKLCWWFATFAKIVVSTLPPFKIALAPLNLFTTSIKLQWCVSTFCWFPFSPLRQNHPKTIFLGPDWQLAEFQDSFIMALILLSYDIVSLAPIFPFQN